jgi:hypothetical protein
VRVAPGMNSQNLANALLAYAKLGRMPERKTWAALEGAAVRVAPGMNSHDVGNTLWSYTTLGRSPEGKTWEALEAAAVRVAPYMVPQALANALWAYAKLVSEVGSYRRNAPGVCKSQDALHRRHHTASPW